MIFFYNMIHEIRKIKERHLFFRCVCGGGGGGGEGGGAFSFESSNFNFTTTPVSPDFLFALLSPPP